MRSFCCTALEPSTLTPLATTTGSAVGRGDTRPGREVGARVGVRLFSGFYPIPRLHAFVVQELLYVIRERLVMINLRERLMMRKLRDRLMMRKLRERLMMIKLRWDIHPSADRFRPSADRFRPSADRF